MLDKAEKWVGVVDAVVPDLEDSVPSGEKATARDLVRGWVGKMAARRVEGSVGSLLVPRVNAIGSGWLEEDMEAVVVKGVDAVSVGKVENGEEVKQLCELIDRAERRAGVTAGKIGLVPWIETARGIVHAAEICTASDRIVAVAFGADDFARDMEIARTPSGEECLHARSTIAIAARAARVAALDTPWTSFRDLLGLEAECRAVATLGFTGKFAIHPDSIHTINTTFSPTPADVAHANDIVAAYESAQATNGRGSTSLDGIMIDNPVYQRAKALIDRAIQPRH